MEKVTMIGASRGAMLAAALISAGGVTLNEVLNPPPSFFERIASPEEFPIFQQELERILRKKARRKLHHRLLKLYLAEARKRIDRPKRNVAIAEFKTLWNKAQADWRRYQRAHA